MAVQPEPLKLTFHLQLIGICYNSSAKCIGNKQLQALLRQLSSGKKWNGVLLRVLKKMTTDITNPLDRIDKPIFLENVSSEIVYANKSALEFFSFLNDDPDTSGCMDLFTPFDNGGPLCIANSSKHVFIKIEEMITVENNTCKKITLTPLSDSPGIGELESYQLMAEKLVHQFRSPLSGSSGFLDMMLQNNRVLPPGRNPSSHYSLNHAQPHPSDDTAVEDPQVRGQLKKVRRGLDQSFLLLDQIEEFATPVTVEKTTFTVNALTLSVLADYSVKEISQMEIIRPDYNLRLETDYYLLNKVISELVRNALEANPATSGKKLTIGFSNDGTIEVSNICRGMSEEILMQMFFPFFSTKALKMGLGLPKCRLYCHKLGLDLQITFDREREVISFHIYGVPCSTDS